MNRRQPPCTGDPAASDGDRVARAKPGRDRAGENRKRIEAAALALFTTQGYHGTNNREIAERAGVSTAAIYLHYPSKEALFVDLVQQYRTKMTEWFEAGVAGLGDPFSKQDLRRFASEIWSKLAEERECLLLVLIDVIEFKNRHFAEFFHTMPARLQRLLDPVFAEVAQRRDWRGHDPAFVLAAVYNYFFHCALLENYMQGERHLGVSNEQAVDRFVDLLSSGLRPAPLGKPRKPTRDAARRQDQAARERIELIRLLCGRLWNPPPEILRRFSGAAHSPAPSPADDEAKVPILFLPEPAQDRPDQNQLAIEAAALELFTTQGFHGTHIREIAERANLSQGTIYTYYPKKEAIFESLAQSYQSCMIRFLRRVIAALDDPLSKDNLRLLAWAVRSMVYDDAQYVLLMFIDVVEFKNRHFADLFRDIPARFRLLLGPALDRATARPGWCELPPEFALATIYFFFFNYFVIERLMRGDQHLGAPDEDAIDRLIELFSDGLWAAEPDAESGRRPPAAPARPAAPP